MLNIIRKNASSLLIKIFLAVIFIVIAIVLIFFGMNPNMGNPSSRVARVNGEPISIESYQQAYKQAIENLQTQYGNKLNRDIIEMLKVDDQVIDSLIERLLLMQAAEKLGIYVSIEELAAVIQSMNVFQDGGTFNKVLYEDVLARNGFTRQIYEDSLREEMVLSKIDAFITNGVKVTEDEILEWYNWINASVAIDYVLFDPSGFKDIEPTEDELNAFFDAYQNNYMTQPKIKVRYVCFPPELFADKAQVEESDIEDYYNINQSEYLQEKTVEARHILLKVDEDATPEIVEEKRIKAEEILKMAREGKDFAELAKEHSEGTTKETGGLLGKFKKDDMVEPFSEAAFSMEAGDISEPVRTQFGWHLIMVEKVNEAHIKPIEEVSDGIREKLTVNRSEQLAYEAAEDTFDKALMDEDFEKAAADLGLTLHSTVYFTSNGSDLEISNPKVFASEAFKLIDLDISDILDIDGKYYIMQKIDELPSQIPDLADVENQVKADLFAKMQDEQARKSAEEFLVVCKETGGLEDAAKEMNVDVFSSGFFKRSESIPGIGYESNIIQAAFTLSDDSKTADSVFPTNSGYYVIQFGGRKSPGTDEIDTQKDTIKEQLISQKKQIIIKDWIDKMRSESEIEKEDRFLD